MSKTIQEILASFEPSDKTSWASAVKKAVRKEEELHALQHQTSEGISLVALYDKEDIKGLDFLGALPGEFPYVSGFPNFESTKLRQRIFTEKFMLANQQASEAFENGADEVEFVGDTVGNDKEFGTLLLGLNPTKHSLHFNFGESNNSLLFILGSEWESKGYDLHAIKGSVYFSPFDRLISTGNYDYSEKETPGLLKTTLEYAIENLPNFKCLSVNGLRFSNAGAGDITEMAFSAAMAVEYLSILEEKGLAVNDVVKHMQIHLSSGSDYLASIAKIRAFRMVWANIADAWGINEFPHINITPSEFSLSLYDIHTNMLRLSSESMSAMLGSADSFTAIPYNDRMELPDAFSYRNARNIWNLLKEESHLDTVQDPAAGSYYIEILTSKLGEATWALFQDVEQKGGFLKCLDTKFIQGSVEKQYTDKLEQFRASKTVLIGTNKYPNAGEKLTGKILKNVARPDMKEEFRVMPLPSKYLSESLDESRIKSEGQAIKNEFELNEEED